MDSSNEKKKTSESEGKNVKLTKKKSPKKCKTKIGKKKAKH